MRRGLGVAGLVVGSLACGGLAGDIVPVRPPETTEASPAPGPAAGPALFLLDPTDGCSWRVQVVGGASREVAHTDVCPTRLWLSPDGQRAVAQGPKTAWHGPLDALVAVPIPPEIEAAWPVDGHPLVGRLEHGDHGVTLVTHRLQGRRFGPPQRTPVSASAMVFGDPLGKHADMDADWLRLQGREADSKTAYADDASDAARAAVEASQDVDVGQLEVGDAFLTYRIEMGDTPHAMAPAVWCPTAACADPTPIPDLPAQFSAEPQGDLVLITAEYSGLQAQVLTAGSAMPAFEAPADAAVMWAPPGL